MEQRPIPIVPTAGGCRFRLRVTPGASADRIVGLHGEALKISVRAAPEKGRANEAVRALIARALGVAAQSVALLAGRGGREKTVRIEGLDAEECTRRIAGLLEANGGGGER